MDQSKKSWTETEGASVTFVPHGARLKLGQGDDGMARSIAMDVNLEFGEDVQLPSKQSLKDVEWSIYLIEALEYNEAAKREGAIGFLTHFEERKGVDKRSSERCHISAALGPERFAALLAALQSGRLPDRIEVRARGLQYGSEPDGSGKVWDTAATPHPSVIKIEFSIPLTAPGDRLLDPLNETGKSDHLPATSGDVRALERKLSDELTAFRGQSSKYWVALLCLVLVLVVLVYFRHIT